jgi:HD-GYP domain-containing protein (c-di-GMP phosphodiesterase class II)
MTGTRPYRGPLSTEAALAELLRCAGSQFDPAVVAVLVGLVRDRAGLSRA